MPSQLSQTRQLIKLKTSITTSKYTSLTEIRYFFAGLSDSTKRRRQAEPLLQEELRNTENKLAPISLPLISPSAPSTSKHMKKDVQTV